MAKTRVSLALTAIALVVCALLVTPTSSADSYVRIVRLSDLDGSVQIDRNTGHGFEKAIQNLPITQGVKLKTGSDGRAEVEFENGSVIRLAGDTSVDFTQLSLQTDGKRLSNVRVVDGVAYVDFRKKGDDNFQLLVGSHTIHLRKDSHFRVKVDSSNAEVAVMKGEIEVEGIPQLAKVKKNETFSLDLSDNTRVMLAKGLTPNSYDSWDQQRSQYLQQYASMNTFGSPYQYGYRDMYRWGMFYNAPGYGTIWRPYGVGLDWDPYSNGYWSNSPVFGWVWCSDYTWGWTPFRYGSWAYIPNFGWSWQPGNWTRWNRLPTYTNPPTNWTRPTPPPPAASGGGTVVVGIPRSPRGPRTIGFDNPNASPNGNVPVEGITGGGAARTLPGSRTTPAVTTTPAGTASAAAASTVPTPRPVQPQPLPNGIRPIRGPRDMDSGRHGGGMDMGGSRSQNPPQPRVQPSQPSPRIETPRTAPPPRVETPRPAPSPRMEGPRMERQQSVPHEAAHPKN